MSQYDGKLTSELTNHLFEDTEKPFSGTANNMIQRTINQFNDLCKTHTYETSNFLQQEWTSLPLTFNVAGIMVCQAIQSTQNCARRK